MTKTRLSPAYRLDADTRWPRRRAELKREWIALGRPWVCQARWCRRTRSPVGPWWNRRSIDLDWHHIRYALGPHPMSDTTVDDGMPLCRSHHSQVTAAWRHRGWFAGTLAAVTNRAVRPVLPRWARRLVLVGLLGWYLAAVYSVDVFGMAARAVELIVGWVIGAPLLWLVMGGWWLLRRRR